MRGWTAIVAMLGAAAAGATATAGAETIAVTGLFAPPAREAAMLRTIAVEPFAGRDGDVVGLAIERRLARGDEDGMRPHFRLVDRAAVAEGTMSGRGDVGVDERDYTETRDRCVERREKKCVARKTFEVGCTRRTVSLHADIRLIRRRDGAVIYAALKVREDDAHWCEDEGGPRSIDETVAGMVRAVAEEVRLDLAPHRESWTTRIRENRDGMAKPVAAAFKDAIRLTKTDAHAACDAFARIDATTPHPSSAFNVALCAESAGDYARARDGYARVAAWMPAKAGDAAKGQQRVARLMLGQRAIDEIRLARGF